MQGANYSGRQPNNTAYIKNFYYGTPTGLWTTVSFLKSDGTVVSAVTTSSPKFENVYIKGDLFVDGSIINPSDINIKTNINDINELDANKIMNLRPTSFTLKDDTSNHKHYGFIAQELEKEYPELIYNKPDQKYANIKAINYLEIIPLLVNKIQMMQKEIDELKTAMNK